MDAEIKLSGKMKRLRFITGIIAVYLCCSSLFPAASLKAISKIPGPLVRQLIKDIESGENKIRLSNRDLKVLHEHLKYELHDLNNDSIPEFFLYIEHHEWCGAGSNCSYWVYQKVGESYQLLLEEKGLRVSETVTNGYKDLASQVPMGFCAINVQKMDASLYKYDGERYTFVSRRDECFPFTPKK
jgi:hypothetical protein